MCKLKTRLIAKPPFAKPPLDPPEMSVLEMSESQFRKTATRQHRTQDLEGLPAHVTSFQTQKGQIPYKGKSFIRGNPL